MPEPLNLFAPAARQKTKLRMALQGVSGGGKTLSALYIAYGMTGDWGKVALIDTEHDRALEYAARSDLPIPTGQFLHAHMDPPYSVEKYIQYVRMGADIVGPDGVVIVDSLSHAWAGAGGVLEYKDAIAATQRGQNSYTAWNAAGKLQNTMSIPSFRSPATPSAPCASSRTMPCSPMSAAKWSRSSWGLPPSSAKTWNMSLTLC